MKRAFAVGCLAIVATGCGDDSQRDVAGSTTSSVASAEFALVDEYVNTLNQGDVADALRLRCAEAQMEDAASEELFTAQVERLVHTVGPIEVVSVELNPSSRLDPLGDGENTRAVIVELSGRDRAGSEPLETVMLEQDDELRLCGVATTSAGALHTDKPSVPELGSSGRTPEELMPTSSGDGDLQQVFDGPTPEPPSSASTSWSRAWQASGYGGISITASEFRTAQEAGDFAARHRDSMLSDTVEVFTAGGGLGLRYLGYAWLWAQPPGVGDHIDDAILLFDDTVVTLRVTLDGAEDHQLVQDLATAVASAAR